MSTTITLLDNDGNAVRVGSHSAGSNIRVGGSPVAEVDVTYNYSPIYQEACGQTLGDMLYGKTGQESVSHLERLVNRLGTETSSDYWEATPGNAGAMAALLLSWAKQYPDAKWVSH